MLILLPESQRIKHDTRTIALHDHQVTFTLSSHPLAVYPVQLGQSRSAKEGPAGVRQGEKAIELRKLPSVKENSLMFSPRSFAPFPPAFPPHPPPPPSGIYLIDATARHTSNKFRMRLHVSPHVTPQIEIRIVRSILGSNERHDQLSRSTPLFPSLFLMFNRARRMGSYLLES